MKDIVFIRGLAARGIIGINDRERIERQVIRIDIEIACDTRVAAENDDIKKAVNYRSVAKAVLSHVEESSYFLVETLAERLAAMIIREFDAPWVRLRVAKPGAVRFSDDVGVEIERGSRDA